MLNPQATFFEAEQSSIEKFDSNTSFLTSTQRNMGDVLLAMKNNIQKEAVEKQNYTKRGGAIDNRVSPSTRTRSRRYAKVKTEENQR